MVRREGWKASQETWERRAQLLADGFHAEIEELEAIEKAEALERERRKREKQRQSDVGATGAKATKQSADWEDEGSLRRVSSGG